MTRLFVAIALPEAVRERLARMAGGIPGARWIGVHQMHLTLRFIGEVDGAVFDDVRSALELVQAPGFDLVLDGVDHFGRGRRARTIWVGVAANPALGHLARKVEAALVHAGLAPESRRFTPHVTLARLRQTSAERVAAFLGTHALFREEPIPVSGFQLFSSQLSHTGAFYRVEEEYALAPPQTPNLSSTESTRIP
jgi:2'-5' RNA ligase